MEIGNSSGLTQNYKAQSPNFGAVKIDSINLMKQTAAGKYTPIKADFLELQAGNKKDISLAQDLIEKWGNLTKYTKEICNNFLNNRKDARFFVTEVTDNNQKRITNIMELDFKDSKYSPKKSLEIEYLQSAPDIADKRGLSPIKGSGEISLYETAKIAKENDLDGFSLYSTNDYFYEKAGMNELGSTDGISMFGISAKRLDGFMKRIAEKYGLKG